MIKNVYWLLNITRKMFNTDRIWIWIFILEEYGPEVEYIQGKNNIMGDALSKIPNNGNKNSTQESNENMETIS